MTTHVKKHFQAWMDGRLDDEGKRLIDDHLGGCADCRLYYDRLSFLLEKPAENDLPRLDPDPALPARIRAAAISAGRANRTITLGELFRPLGWVRLSLTGAMLVIAVVLGVMMGRGVASEAVHADSDIYSEYYEAFSQSTLVDTWESVIETENGS